MTRSIGRSNGVRCSRRPWNLAQIRSTPGHQVPADRVHHVVAEALQQAHHRLRLPEQRRCSSDIRRSSQCVVAAAVAAERRAHRTDASLPSAGVVREERQLALQALGKVRPEPGMRLELEGVRRLVERDPGPERIERHIQRPGGVADVLLHEQQAPGVVSADSSARSYWPSTRWPMKPSRRPSWRVVTQRLAS